MLFFTTKKAISVLYKVVLTVFILLSASCSGLTTPTLEPPLSITMEQVTDWPDSARKIETGQHLRFEHISLEQGLSQSTVFCMLQDSQGFMWFGTEDGLNKYDGYNFTIYKPEPEDPNSLAVRWIQTLFEDDSGMLWIGTNKGGLSRFDRTLDHFIHYRNDPGDPGSLSNDDVTAIYQDMEGTLWIGTSGGGLNRFDQENKRFVQYQHNPENPNSLSSNVVSVIYQDQEGLLWIGTGDGGLNTFDSKNNRWWHFGNDPNYPDNQTHNTITAISEDQSGTLWIGTGGGGLVRYDWENEQFIHYHHDPDDPGSLSSDEITSIYHDMDDVLWIGTYGDGLNKFDPERESFVHYQNVPSDPHSLSQDTILSIYQDKEGVLWFGTIGGGVNKLNNSWRNFTLYQNNPEDPNSLGDNMVRAFYHDIDDGGDALWVGSMFGGLDRFDRQMGTWRHYRHDPNNPDSLSNDFVSYVYRDHTGALWIGTASGLDKFNPESETFTHFQPDPNAPPGSPGNNVRTIYEYHAGMFWIGTQGGLYQFDQRDESWSQPYRHDPDDPNSLSKVWVFAFLEDRDGMIWFGTVGAGLYKFDPAKEHFTQYQNEPDNPNSLGNDVVVSPIFQDREGALWIGNLSGLDRFDPGTETFTHYREKDGLPNETVYCIAEDRNGHLWVSTNEGLSRFDPGTETFRNYDVTDGLQSNEFNSNACLRNNSGEMFFGGIDGFNVFYPNQITDNLTAPPIELTQLIYGDEQVNLGQAGRDLMDVTLHWPDNAFEFEYAALSFAQPEKNQYAYYLEGFEEGWNEVGTRRFGSYTNLSGGTYTLHVKGSNNDGVWNETGTSLKITIVPPFWGTWWFRGAAALLLVGVAFLGYRLRIRNVEKRSRELEIQVEERTTELQREIAQRTQAEEALRNSEMETAIAAERSRLARDLHDSVTQSLYSLTLFTEAARHMAEEAGNESIEQYVGQIGTIGLQALKEMRLLVFELQPAELEKEGLVPALRRRLEAVEGRAGVDARVVVDDFARLPGNIEQELFRIAQEALNNALKHAAASSVVVHLRRDNDSIEMEIVDDGVGFDPEALSDTGGMGLKNIRARSERIGGIVDIRSKPGEGTNIKITMKDLRDVTK
jgi:signal transduction histidine kinase/ligand-binding sensor domain-containing protein